MFNFGSSCTSDHECGIGSCLINLIILFVILEFLCGILSGSCNNGLNCGC